MRLVRELYLCVEKFPVNSGRGIPVVSQDKTYVTALCRHIARPSGEAARKKLWQQIMVTNSRFHFRLTFFHGRGIIRDNTRYTYDREQVTREIPLCREPPALEKRRGNRANGPREGGQGMARRFPR